MLITTTLSSCFSNNSTVDITQTVIVLTCTLLVVICGSGLKSEDFGVWSVWYLSHPSIFTVIRVLVEQSTRYYYCKPLNICAGLRKKTKDTTLMDKIRRTYFSFLKLDCRITISQCPSLLKPCWQAAKALSLNVCAWGENSRGFPNSLSPSENKMWHGYSWKAEWGSQSARKEPWNQVACQWFNHKPYPVDQAVNEFALKSKQAKC